VRFLSLVTRLPAVPGFPVGDLPVVHVSWSGDRLPPGMWSLGTSVHGTVSERVNETLRPVAGATVTLDGGTQDTTCDDERDRLLYGLLGSGH
jgi:hypothetical protein